MVLGAAIFGACAVAGTIRAAGPTSTRTGTEFGAHWQDGRAELNGYRYEVTRYGETRTGRAVLVYVTEPMSEVKRVKVDDPKRNPKDVFEALKVNFVRTFQTGIYDYHTMVSLFVRTRDLTPVKVTFSAAEWCGHVFEEMVYERHHLADRYASYFEGESDSKRLTLQENGICEEELLVKLRDFRGPWLKPGERRNVPFLPSSFRRRLAHRPLAWSTAKIERAGGAEAVRVPAGSFLAFRYTIRVQDGRQGTYWVEQAYPHRIVRWEWRPGSAAATGGRGFGPGEGCDKGELLGSTRLPYWQLNRNGDEKELRALGLSPVGGEPPSGKRR